MKGWAPIWNTIVGSSLWDEEDWVMKIFVTMLALKDFDDIVRLTAYQLGKESRKTEQQVLDALKILSSPDTKRIEPQPFEGRRIKAVEEGWFILNAEKYRKLVQIEMKRARDRKAQAAWRQRQKENGGGSGPQTGEGAYVRASDAGASEAQLDSIVTETVPDGENGPI